MSNQDKVGSLHTVIGECDGYTFVQYHRTKVVKWNGREIVLDTGGWETPTTNTRMNQTANQFNLGYQVYQKKGQWFVSYKDQDIPFEGNKVVLSRISGPIYPRDHCEYCVFLGNYHNTSLYYCNYFSLLNVQFGPETTQWWSKDPKQVTEGMDLDQHFIEAKRLAVEKGLINE